MPQERYRLRIALVLLCAALSGHRAAAQQQAGPLATAAGLVRAGKYDQAIDEVQHALRTHPNDARLLTIAGVAYSLKGDDAAALHSLDSALRLDPQMIAALRAKAQIEVRIHRPEAIPVLKQILRLDAQDSTAREMLALEQAHASQCDAAIASFAQAGAAAETHAISLLRYGSCLFTLGRNAEAAEQFKKLVTLAPASPDARYDLALSQLRAGDAHAALETLKPITSGPGDVDSLSLASEAAEATGDTPEAATLLRRAIVLDPTSADGYVRFAELCMQHESYRAGIDMVSAGLSRMPQVPALYLARGMLYGGEANYDKAESDFRSAENFDPKHGTGSYGVGLVQAQANHTDQALKTIREGLRTHPNDGQLNLLLARLLIEGGERPGSPGFTEALGAADTAVRVRPDLTAAHNELSKIYMLQGETAKAIVECRAALALDPEDTVAMYRLMLASRKIGDQTTVDNLKRRVAEGHQKARIAETDRLRYRIEGASNGDAAAPPLP